jgi:nucleoside-diphosphate-sugar epimerase
VQYKHRMLIAPAKRGAVRPNHTTQHCVQYCYRAVLRGWAFRPFVVDRPGHDFRYEIDPSRAEAALGWTAPHDFETGLARTIDWCLAHRDWWQGLRDARYAGQRLGTAA